MDVWLQAPGSCVIVSRNNSMFEWSSTARSISWINDRTKSVCQASRAASIDRYLLNRWKIQPQQVCSNQEGGQYWQWPVLTVASIDSGQYWQWLVLTVACIDRYLLNRSAVVKKVVSKKWSSTQSLFPCVGKKVICDITFRLDIRFSKGVHVSLVLAPTQF